MRPCPRTTLALSSLVAVAVCVSCAAAREPEPCIGADVRVPLRWADPSGVTRIDLLFVIDQPSVSTDIEDELADEAARMVSVMASGSFLGSSFFPIRDVHVGVVSTDLGAGAAPVAGCAGLGADALLQACPGDSPHAVVRGGDATALRCALSQDTECGVSQPLESLLKALSPATGPPGTVPVRFADADGSPGATAGHGDGANAGFVRDELLVVVLVTGRDDCSLDDTRSARGTDPIEDPDRWCASHPALLHAVSRFTDGLAGARIAPWLSIIAGVPESLEASDDAVAATLDDPRLTPTTADDGSLAASCESARVRATPPSRLLAFAASAQLPVDVTSICRDSLRPAFDRLLTRVAALQCPAACLGDARRVRHDGMIACDVLELLPEHGESTSCAALPGRELAEVVELPSRGPQELCRVTQLSAEEGARGVRAGWWYDETSSALAALCPGRIARVAVSEHAPTPVGAELVMTCASTVSLAAPDALCDGDEPPFSGCTVGMPCDPSAPERCGAALLEDRVRREGTWVVDMRCDAVERVCAVACASDEDCAVPGLTGQRCDLRTNGRAADQRGLVIDPASREATRGVCVRPSCG